MLIGLNEEPITTVIVDDDYMVREGFRLLLESRGVKVLGTTGNGRDAIFLVADLRPRLALIDIQLLCCNGIDIAAEIHKQYPCVGLIMLTAHLRQEYVLRSFRVGAKAYVYKGGSPIELELAIASVASGLAFISPVVTNDVITDYLNRGSCWHDGEQLTRRDRELLQLIAEGSSNKEIASTLQLSLRTAEKYRCQLTKRLGSRSTADLVMVAIRAGLVDPFKKKAS